MVSNEFGIAEFAWTGGSAPWAVRSAIADGLERAAEHVKRTMRRLINKPYPPASRPGQPPRKRRPSTGLRANIDIWINRKTLQAYVGPNRNAPHGIWLEKGTRKMKPRPFMMRALRMERTRVNNIIKRAATVAFNKHAKQSQQKGRKR